MGNPKDFSARQIRTSQLIASGGIAGTKAGLIVYSASISSPGFTPDLQGAIPPHLLRDVGTDVYFFVSGSKDSKVSSGDSGNGYQGVTLFGGDVVFSGTMYAERMVVEVDMSSTGSLLVSGTLFVSRSAIIQQGLIVNNEKGASDHHRLVFSGSSSSPFQDLLVVDPGRGSGRVGIGFGTGSAPDYTFEVMSDKNSLGRAAFTQYSSDVTDGAKLILRRARGGAVSTSGVLDGDVIGSIDFNTADGTDFTNVSAQVLAEVDGPVATNSIPGAITIRTTKEGESGTVERVRVTNKGFVGIGTVNPKSIFHVGGNSGNDPTTVLLEVPNAPDMSGSIGFIQGSNLKSVIQYDYTPAELSFKTARGSDLIRGVDNGLLDQVLILSGGSHYHSDPKNMSDVSFFVSGAVNHFLGGNSHGRDTSGRGTAAFGGDVTITGSLWVGHNRTVQPSAAAQQLVVRKYREFREGGGSDVGTPLVGVSILGDSNDDQVSLFLGAESSSTAAQLVYKNMRVGGGNPITVFGSTEDNSEFNMISSARGGLLLAPIRGEAGANVGIGFKPEESWPGVLGIGSSILENQVQHTLDIRGDGSTSSVFLLSGSGDGTGPNESGYTDTNFFVSGTIGSKGSSTKKGTSVFGGDVVISGSLYGGSPLIVGDGIIVTGSAHFGAGLSGSLTKLPDGTSYLVAGSNVSITSASNGAITISSTGGGSSTPVTGTFNVVNENDFVTTASVSFAGEKGFNYAPSLVGTDVFFFASGNIGTMGGEKHSIGVTVFGGDTVVSGNIHIGAENRKLIFSHSGSANYAKSVGPVPGETYYATDIAGRIVRLGDDASELMSIPGTDVGLQFSGSRDSKNTRKRGVSVFEGDTVISGVLYLEEQPLGTPGTIADGTVALYGKDSGGITKLYFKNESGETEVGSGAGEDEGDDFFVSPSNGLLNTTGSTSFAGALGDTHVTTQIGSDVFFFVSGALGSRGTSRRGTSVLGGDAVISGSLVVNPENKSVETHIFNSQAGSPVFKVDSTGVIVNEQGLAINDFRVESSANAYMLFVDAGQNRIGIGQTGNNPQATVHVKDDAPIFRIQRNLNNKDSTLDFAGSAGHVGAVMHLSNSNDLVFKTHNGSYTEEMFRIGSHWGSLNRQIIFLSGSGMGIDAMQPKRATDIAFFVSGAMGSKNTDRKGAAVFGGDVVISGTLHGGSPLRIGDSALVSGSIFIKKQAVAPSPSNTNEIVLYALDQAGTTKFFFKDGSGATTEIGSGGGNGNGSFFKSPSNKLISTSGSAAFAGDLGDTFVTTAAGADVFLFVSGAIGRKSSSDGKTALFGGDVHVSGTFASGEGTARDNTLMAAFGDDVGNYARNANNSDIAFIVSGSAGSRGTSRKGVAVFGGDLVTSGSSVANSMVLSQPTRDIIKREVGNIKFDAGSPITTIRTVNTTAAYSRKILFIKYTITGKPATADRLVSEILIVPDYASAGNAPALSETRLQTGHHNVAGNSDYLNESNVQFEVSKNSDGDVILQIVASSGFSTSAGAATMDLTWEKTVMFDE